MNLQAVLGVGLGGFIGASVRFALATWMSDRVNGLFPWPTFLINVTGSLVIGFVLELATGRGAIDPRWRLVFVTGFLGAYTTFSTFSWELFVLVEQSELRAAVLYAVGSVVLGFIGVLAGVWLARWI